MSKNSSLVRFVLRVIINNWVVLLMLGLFTGLFLLGVRAAPNYLDSPQEIINAQLSMAFVYVLFTFFLGFVTFSYTIQALLHQLKKVNGYDRSLVKKGDKPLFEQLSQSEGKVLFIQKSWGVNNRLVEYSDWLFYEDIFIVDLVIVKKSMINRVEVYHSKNKNYMKAYIYHKTFDLEIEDILIFNSLDYEKVNLKNYLMNLPNAKELSGKEFNKKLYAALRNNSRV